MRIRPISFGKYAAVVKNASYLTLFEILRMVMPFIALPYLMRTVGADNYGIVVYAQALVACFILVVNFGLDISAVKDVSMSRNDPHKLNEIVSSVLIIKALLGLASFAVLTLLILTIPRMHRISLLLYFSFLACISDILLPVWYYQGKENMKLLTIVRFFSITFYTVSIFIFIRSTNDYVYIPLLQSSGLILSALISCYFVFVKDKIRFYIPPFGVVKQKFRESAPFFLSRASLVINSYMAKIMSGWFLSWDDVAAFDIVQKIYNGAMIPMQMFNQALYPNLAKSQDKQMLSRSLGIVAILTLAVACVIFLISGIATDILSAGKTPQAGDILRIMCLAIFMSGFSVFLGASVLVSFGYQRPFNLSVILSTVALLVCYVLMILTDNNSIYLYALTLVVAELVVVGYRFYYCRKYGLVKFKDLLLKKR
ncbi:MAG: oligosaccharide flippase family protein [Tannerella sp.]|jgi:PST family polysaccharide transporter|nr:oligosaccharide flippase family protein [Tannerella sp.]